MTDTCFCTFKGQGSVYSKCFLRGLHACCREPAAMVYCMQGSRRLLSGSAAELICAMMHSLAGSMIWGYCCIHIIHVTAATLCGPPAAMSVTLCCVLCRGGRSKAG